MFWIDVFNATSQNPAKRKQIRQSQDPPDTNEKGCAQYIDVRRAGIDDGYELSSSTPDARVGRAFGGIFRVDERIRYGEGVRSG